MTETPPQTADAQRYAGPPTAPADHHADQTGVISVLRDWLDAIIVAVILALFVRVFLLEMFEIPSGSMTPTLIGGDVARLDYNQDGREDLVAFLENQKPLLFLNDGAHLVAEGPIGLAERPSLAMPGRVTTQRDKILVNKLAYWFHQPRRGDIVVFKVPERIWTEDKPIYIKRCVGEAGDVLSFDGQGGLIANDRRVQQPEFFSYQHYLLSVPGRPGDSDLLPEVSYDLLQNGESQIRKIHVNMGEIYVFGDNTWGSLDSRIWGGVPLDHVKGRAFCRIWPLGQVKSLAAG